MLCERFSSSIINYNLLLLTVSIFYWNEKEKSCMTQVQVVLDVTYYIIPLRMDQACGVHTWLRQHPPVSQPAPGDLWGDRVEHPGHRRAPDRPHWEGLWPRQLLWQISAAAVWWVRFTDQNMGLFRGQDLFFSDSLCVLHQVPSEAR